MCTELVCTTCYVYFFVEDAHRVWSMKRFFKEHYGLSSTSLEFLEACYVRNRLSKWAGEASGPLS